MAYFCIIRKPAAQTKKKERKKAVAMGHAQDKVSYRIPSPSKIIAAVEGKIITEKQLHV